MSDSNINPSTLRTAAVCGLFCPSCSFYIGTQEAPARLANLAQRLGKPVEDCRCDGCRSERTSFFCRTLCTFKACAGRKGVEFCGSCDEFPCEDLKKFQALMPHRAGLWDALARIKEVGWETWYAEAAKHYACPECGTINSAYDLSCRSCGHQPGNEFVVKHKKTILEFLAKGK